MARRTPPRSSARVGARAILVLLALVLGPVVTPAAGASRAPVLGGGYGAPLAGWLRAHPGDRVGCDANACYGPVVQSASPEPEFSFVVTMRHRVVGYDQALRLGTPLLQAELEVAEQFPADVEMAGRVTVVHRDRYGHSCAVYDLYSKTLAKLFGKRGPAGLGDTIGVELATVGRSGTTSYHANAINLAIVAPVYLDGSVNC